MSNSLGETKSSVAFLLPLPYTLFLGRPCEPVKGIDSIRPDVPWDNLSSWPAAVLAKSTNLALARNFQTHSSHRAQKSRELFVRQVVLEGN